MKFDAEFWRNPDTGGFITYQLMAQLSSVITPLVEKVGKKHEDAISEAFESAIEAAYQVGNDHGSVRLQSALGLSDETDFRVCSAVNVSSNKK